MEKTHLSRVTPCLILWFLWAERNRCRHNEAPFRSQNVVWQVQMHFRKLFDSGKLNRKQRDGVIIPWSTAIHSDLRRPAQLVLPVKWNPPDSPWLKLNTVSRFSETTGHASGRGIIRDHRGRLLLAFSTPLSAKSALEASAKTMILGISEAKEFGAQIWIETDDPQVVPLAKSSSYGPAQSRQEMACLIMMKKDCNISFHSMCRARNKAAISLAKQGSKLTAPCRFNEYTASRMLKAIIWLEHIGFPYLDGEIDR